MSKLRFKVVESAFEKKTIAVTEPTEKPSEYFGSLVFNREKMFKYLPEKVYEKLTDCIDNNTPLDRETANAVAAGMKRWALEMGVTHYTHWFHPLTEGTAENMTPSFNLMEKGVSLKNLMENYLFSRNLMLPVSRTVVSVIHLKHAVILHGIRHLQHLS